MKYSTAIFVVILTAETSAQSLTYSDLHPSIENNQTCQDIHQYNTQDPSWYDVHQAEESAIQHRSNAHIGNGNFFDEIRKADQAEIDALRMRDNINRREQADREIQQESESQKRQEFNQVNNHPGQLNQVKGRKSRRELERMGYKIEPGILVNDIQYCDPMNFKLKYVTLPKRPPSSIENMSNHSRETWMEYANFYDQFYQVAAIFETAYERSGKAACYEKIIKSLCKLSKSPAWKSIASLQPFKVKHGKQILSYDLDDFIVLAHQVKPYLLSRGN